MMPMMGQVTPGILALMFLCVGVGLAFGLFLLSGGFYLFWRLVRALERRSG